MVLPAWTASYMAGGTNSSVFEYRLGGGRRIVEEKIEMILRGSQFKQLREYELAEIRKSYQLKRIEVEILYFLSNAGEQNTSADICRRLKANKGQISQAVEHLCRMKYLMAMQDAVDRRYVHYYVTDSSKEIIEQIAKKWKELTDALFVGVTREEMEELKNIAGKISRNMETIISRKVNR